MGHNNLKQEQVLKLLKCLWKQVIQLPDSEIADLIRSPYRLIFVAAELGNTVFLTELLHSYPDLIWRVDNQDSNIFHIAVLHRHEGIFNLIYEIGSIKDLIVSYRDDDRNNMLHLAGKLACPSRLNIISGAALQMQRELLWFKVNSTLSVFKFIIYLTNSLFCRRWKSSCNQYTEKRKTRNVKHPGYCSLRSIGT